MLAKYDALNPPALRRLVANGVQLRPFSNEIMAGLLQGGAARCTTRRSAKNAKFKKIYEPWKKFRDEEDLWFRVAEKRFDNFMIAAQRRARRRRAKK